MALKEAGYIVYKCRLCGKEVEDLHAPDGLIFLIAATLDMQNNKFGRTINGRDMFTLHWHEDGSIGVADLIGFRPDKKGDTDGT